MHKAAVVQFCTIRSGESAPSALERAMRPGDSRAKRPQTRAIIKPRAEVWFFSSDPLYHLVSDTRSNWLKLRRCKPVVTSEDSRKVVGPSGGIQRPYRATANSPRLISEN